MGRPLSKPKYYLIIDSELVPWGNGVKFLLKPSMEWNRNVSEGK